MLIYPAIDIRNGAVVRLSQGRFDRETVYDASPYDVAVRFAEAGFRRLHIVDLDGAVSGAPVNTGVIRRMTSLSSLRIQVGGGIRSLEAAQSVLTAGAERVILGSVALQRRSDVREWIRTIGPSSIACAVDIRNGTLATHGWTDGSDVRAEDFMRSYLDAGVSRFIVTDISRDGMMTGPAFDLYETLLRSFPEAQIIASGGVSSLDDVNRLGNIGVTGVITGRAVFDGAIDLSLLAAMDTHDRN